MFDVEKVCREAKEAANLFSSVSEEKKNELLTAIKNSVWDNRKAIIAINAQDVEEAEKNGIPSALIDRLTLNEQRIETMCKGIDDIVALPDYVGKVEEEYTLKNGLQVKKVHAPLGVVGIIYEARPNVTVDAAALCIKSGNAVILKGGKEAIHTNRFLAMLMKQAFFSVGLRDELIGFIDGTERELTAKMLSLGEYIDVVIPRGGEKLKKYVLSAATMPVIASSGGNCHVYVEKTAVYGIVVLSWGTGTVDSAYYCHLQSDLCACGEACFPDHLPGRIADDVTDDVLCAADPETKLAMALRGSVLPVL